jgi:hypothetical protein
VDAVRKRVQRGTIEHEKDAAGRVRILLDSPDNASTLRDERPDTTGQASALVAAKDETIEELRDRVRRLEHDLDIRNEEIRRRDHIIVGMVERLPPALEAPPPEPREARESPTPSPQASEGTRPSPEREEAQEPAQRPTGVPWWRRWFGG